MCRNYCLVAVVAVLFGCSPPSNIRVVERETIDSRIETERIGGAVIRIVQSGDTLHAIAFASGLNVNQVADWNNLEDTGKLQIGQRIRLTRPLGYVAPRRPAADTPVPKRTATDSTAETGVVRAEPQEVQRSAGATATGSPLHWVWPTKGKLIGHFATSQTQQGIDIQGKAGQPVVASETGEVVYVGNGLKGYGNLVIIKHNDEFLSAYAHNRETFVSEGQRVVASTKIGAVGLDKQRRNALHFQIRQDGIPVNPLAYLPKR